MIDLSIRDLVRERYARAATELQDGGCCGTPTPIETDPAFGAHLYTGLDTGNAPAQAVAASLGCGVPTAVADLHPGDVVLDLGSGAGLDALITAKRVGPSGRVIGLDMTPEMLAAARRNAESAGVDNVEFIEGYLEDIPLPDGTVSVVISNCVLNLAADKGVVTREAFRVLRPGGRLAVSDVIIDGELDAETRADVALWTGCIAGALTEREFRIALGDAGFTDIEITPTHRVHRAAQAAIIRANKPLMDGSAGPS